MHLKSLIILLFSSVILAGPKVFNTNSKTYVDYNDFIKALPTNSHIILGEFHNDMKIQQTQAKIIDDTVNAQSAIGSFNINWEFLNFTDQQNISQKHRELLNKAITPLTFLENTAGKNLQTYLPIIEKIQKLKGNIFGTNLPRPIKQQAMRYGIQSVDANLIPQSHYLGSSKLLERFTAVMGGHVPADKLSQYFLAQSLTDSVLAHHSVQNETNLNFLIAGSFHTDFFDAATIKIKELTNLSVVSLKIINPKELTKAQVQMFLNGDQKYGQYADFIILTH